MPFTHTKTCPRCGKPFICRVDEMDSCDCRLVKLSEAQYQFIKSNFTDCLCLTCLTEIVHEIK